MDSKLAINHNWHKIHTLKNLEQMKEQYSKECLFGFYQNSDNRNIKLSEKIANYSGVNKCCLSSLEIDNFIEKITLSNLNNLTVLSDGEEGYQPLVLKNIRNGKGQDITSIIEPLFQRIGSGIVENTLDIKINYWNKCLLRYYESGGCYELHFDNGGFFKDLNGVVSDKKVCDRDYSVILCLADGYEGGEIFFPYKDISFKLKKGEMIFFPSGKDFSHKVCEVKKGKRIMAISFLNIKNEK